MYRTDDCYNMMSTATIQYINTVYKVAKQTTMSLILQFRWQINIVASY